LTTTGASGAALRCLVVEDDPDNAELIARGLRALGFAAEISSNGPQALSRAADEDWDILILDRMLPDGIDGLEILATLRRLGRTVPVLVLSALSGLDERVRGLRAGGDDYLTKPFAFDELAARVDALLRRARREPQPRRLQVGTLQLDFVERRVLRDGQPIALKPREFRLLAFFMMHPGQILTRSMLLEAVWDYRFDPQTNVVDVQVSRLRAKIDPPGMTPMIHTVRGTGYTMRPAADTPATV